MAYFIMLRRFDFVEVCIKLRAAIQILWLFNANKSKNRCSVSLMDIGLQGKYFIEHFVKTYTVSL